MIKDIMDDIISERKSKNIEDDYGIQNCWNKMIDILSKDINETVAYLENCSEEDIYFISEVFEDVSEQLQTSVYKGYKQDKIEMRGDRAEMSDFPLYLNTVAGGLDRRDQTIGGFSFVVKIYAVPVVEIIG